MTKVPAAVRGGKAYSGKPVPRVGKLHDISVKDKQGLDLIEPAADIEGVIYLKKFFSRTLLQKFPPLSMYEGRV